MKEKKKVSFCPKKQRFTCEVVMIASDSLRIKIALIIQMVTNQTLSGTEFSPTSEKWGLL